MEDKRIKAYAKLMHELDLSGLELTENGCTLRLERAMAAPAPVAVPAMAPMTAVSADAAPAEDIGVVSITSPMVGVFYASPAENQEAFISPGSTVRRGEVICIIESMKLMNEIVSDYDGTVLEVCVSNQQVVDFGMPLFRIKKEHA